MRPSYSAQRNCPPSLNANVPLLIGTKENVLPANMLLFCLSVSEPKIAEYSGKHTISVRFPSPATYCSCATSPLRTRKTLGGLPSSGPWRSSPDTVSTNTTVMCDVKSRGSAWIELLCIHSNLRIARWLILHNRARHSSMYIRFAPTPTAPTGGDRQRITGIQSCQDHQAQPVIDQRGNLAGVLYPRLLLAEIFRKFHWLAVHLLAPAGGRTSRSIYHLLV